MRPRPCLSCAVVIWTGLGTFLGHPGGATTIVVTTTADIEADDGVCSLREAATSTNTDTASGALPGECAAGEPGDTVIFALPPGAVIPLTFQPVIFTQSVTIWGPGADSLEIAQAGADRVLIFDGLADPLMGFDLVGVRLRGGEATSSYLGTHFGEGGGLLAVHYENIFLAGVVFTGNSALQGGGAIYLDQRTGGHGLIQDSTFESNSAGGGVAGGGGAMVVELDGDLTIRRSLFVGNSATNPGFAGGTQDDGQGGAIWVPPLATGTLDILESTFSSNSAAGNGGALSFGSLSAPAFGPLVVTHIVDSTFTLNGADSDLDAPTQSGGALNTSWSSEVVTLTNSIVAANLDHGTVDSAPDLLGSSSDLASGGFNLIGIRRGAGAIFAAGLPNAGNDWVGGLLNPLDPGLEPLGDNGGVSQSHRPTGAPTSVAIDHGSCAGSYHDQRDWANASERRLFDDATVVDLDDGCDIGAIEIGLGPRNLIFADTLELGDLRFWSGVVGWTP